MDSLVHAVSVGVKHISGMFLLTHYSALATLTKNKAFQRLSKKCPVQIWATLYGPYHMAIANLMFCPEGFFNLNVISQKFFMEQLSSWSPSYLIVFKSWNESLVTQRWEDICSPIKELVQDVYFLIRKLFKNTRNYKSISIEIRTQDL